MNSTGLARHLEHRARPEAALPVGLAVVEAGLGHVGFGIDDRLERAGRRIEEIEAADHGHDQPALRAQAEAAEVFRRLQVSSRAGRRIVAMDQLAPDVDPPQDACAFGIPDRALAEHGLGVDDAGDFDHVLVSLVLSRVAPQHAGRQARQGLAADRHGQQDDHAIDDQQRAARQVERRQQPGQDGQHQGAGDGADDSGRCRPGSRRRRSPPPRSR